MAKRIYFESIKKWAKGAGIPAGVAGFTILFMYLSFLGVIEVSDYSGDIICAGTESDPCIALINFSVKEDIFIYPIGYDPWGRETPFETDKELRSWKMYRSWGSSWREIKLDRACTATWCGAPPNSPDNKYAFAFREGRDYKIKIEALKNDPKDTIKWGFGPVDPFWYGVGNVTANISASTIIIELGYQVNISTNISGASDVCVDVGHPEYGDNYTCGSPTADFLFNISYFRKKELNDSSTEKNITFQLQGVGNYSNIGGLSSSCNSVGGSYYIINYTKPVNANNAIWQVKHSNISSYNITIPQSCFDNTENLSVGFLFNNTIVSCVGTYSIQPYCLNSTGWVKIGTNLTAVFSGTGSSTDAVGNLNDGNWDTGATASCTTCTVGRSNFSTIWDPVPIHTLYEEAMFWNMIEGSSCYQETSTVNDCHFLQEKVYIKGHQYDEIMNVSINLTTANQISLSIYINNTLSNSLGLFSSENINLIEFNDGSNSTNLTFAFQDLQTVYLDLPKNTQILNATLNLTGFPYASCYQESANVSTSCGGLDTGNYLIQVGVHQDTVSSGGIWGDCSLGGSSIVNTTFVYVNYTKPSNASSAIWKFIRGYATDVDFDIPFSCFNNSVVSMRINLGTWVSASGSALVGGDCLNATEEWERITTCVYGSGGGYESSDISSAFDGDNTTAVLWVPPLGGFIKSDGGGTGVTYDDLDFFEEGINWIIENGSSNYPTNISLEVGLVDGINEWNSTFFNITNITDNFNHSIMDFLDDCTADSDGFCTVPLYFTTFENLGRLNVQPNIIYINNPNPVYLDHELISSFLGNSTNLTDIPIKFESTKNGTLQISDIRFDYAGGNDTIKVLTYEPGFTNGSLLIFNNSLKIENLTFAGNENITRYLDLPIGANITSSSLNLSGFYNSSSERREYYDVNDNDGLVTDGGYVQAQTFTTGDVGTNEDFIVGKVSLKGWDEDNGDLYDISVMIMEVNETGATDTVLAYNYSIDIGLWPDGAANREWVNITLELTAVLSASTQYALVINSTAPDGTDRFRWAYDNAGATYEGGNTMWNASGCADGINCIWNNETGADNMFEIFKEARSYISNPYLEIGSPDEIHEWNYTGEFNHTDNKTEDLSTAINAALNSGACNCTGCILDVNCSVPFQFHSDTLGTLQYDWQTLDYNILDPTNKSNNDTLDLIHYYSDFYKNLPYLWTDKVFFMPHSNSSKNVSAYGQTNTIPIFNITTTNYGGKNMNLSIRINQTFSCMNLTISSESSKISLKNVGVPTTCGDSTWSTGEANEWYSNWSLNGDGRDVTLKQLGFYTLSSLAADEQVEMALYNSSLDMIVNTSVNGTGSTEWVFGETDPVKINTNTTYFVGLAKLGSATFQIRRDADSDCADYLPNQGTYHQTFSGGLDLTVPTGASQSANHYIIPNITIDISLILNNSWSKIFENLEYLNNSKIWMWVDLDNCKASETRVLTPEVQIESYCVDCIWEI